MLFRSSVLKTAKRLRFSLAEILDYQRLHPRLSGSKADELHTQFHGRLAAPFTCLVVVLLALPFGAAPGRRNVAVGVGVSIAIAFAFFVLSRLSLVLGTGGHVPGWVAGWLPNVAFGTVGVRVGGRDLEVTTFRGDVYRPESRKPEVSFADDVESDLVRRDFTVNTLLENLHTGEVLDLLIPDFYPNQPRLAAFQAFGYLITDGLRKTRQGQARHERNVMFGLQRALERLTQTFRITNNYLDTQLTSRGDGQFQLTLEPTAELFASVSASGLPPAVYYSGIIQCLLEGWDVKNPLAEVLQDDRKTLRMVFLIRGD